MSRRTSRIWLLASGLAAVSALGFILVSHHLFRVGFPLDDAWIHQTYARNIVEIGEWSYVPGQASGGSTSPLWTLSIAFGNALGIHPKVWTYLIGTISLCLLAGTGWNWLKERRSNRDQWNLLVIVVLIFEWHLTWAAVSGMETIAVSLLFLLVFLQLERCRSELLIGVLVGVGLWLRPGSLTLFLPIAMYLIDRHSADIGKWAGGMARCLLGFSIMVIPYLLLNFSVADSMLPNTFYAKQAEYALLRERSILTRLFEQFAQPMTGIGITLLPGVVIAHLGVKKEKGMSQFAPILWILAYAGSYAIRLPVTYQHGRYVIPIIPVLIVLGVEGFFHWIELGSSQTAKRFLSRTWLALSLALLLAFWVIGARAYAQDVAIIESEMVEAAKWIAEHTEEEDLIAAHDIGALGYYGQRDILDLAGLVSPEVIPFIRDESLLAGYIRQQGATYLMTFPGWYPQLSSIGEPVYRSKGRFSPRAGGENMEIFRWP